MKFQPRACPTVAIVTEAGPVNINKSNYDADPEKYNLYEGEETIGTDGSETDDTEKETEEKSETPLKRRVKKTK